MNKLYTLAIAAFAAFAAVSCQKTGLADGDYVTARIDIVSPFAPQTKAVGDGTKAANLVFAVYPYYIGDQAASESASELSELRQGDWTKNQSVIKFDNELKTTVSVRLVRGKAYQFVCWAQYEDAGCFDFTEMHSIKVDYSNANSQDDLRDAFYSHDITLDQNGNPAVVTSAFSQTITLKRPFAQVNVGSKDMKEALAAGLDTTKIMSSMVVKAVPDQLNPLSNTVEGAVDAEFLIKPAVTGVLGTEVLIVNNDIQNPYGWLAMNYVLTAPVDDAGNGTDHDVHFTLYDGSIDPASQLATYEVNNVELKRNHRTHLLGNVLTADGQITVEIQPGFDDEILVSVD